MSAFKEQTSTKTLSQGHALGAWGLCFFAGSEELY